jgi:hypothetical protein
MPVRPDWLIVRLVGEVEPIATFPLATVPPVGRGCANDGCAQPRPHNSAIKLTEARNSLVHDLMAGERHDVDETINRTTIRLKPAALQSFPSPQFLCWTCTVPCMEPNVASNHLRMSQRTSAIYQKIANIGR